MLITNFIGTVFPLSDTFYIVAIILTVNVFYAVSRNDFYLLTAIFIIFFKSFFLMTYYPPLDSIDAYNYYYQAFLVDDSSEDIILLFQMLFFEGHFSIVEMTSVLYRIIALVFGSSDPIVLVFANYFFILWSALILASILNLQGQERGLFIVFVVLSPLLGKYSTFLLKESLSCFMVILMLYYFIKKRFFTVFVIMIFATIVRPYSCIILLSYLIFFGKISIRWSVALSIIIFFTIYAVMKLTGTVNLSLIALTKNIILSAGAIIAAPNFLRIESWLNYPFLVFESMILFIALSWYLFTVERIKRYRLIMSIIALSIILGGVSYNRSSKIGELESVKEGSLLYDDIARKKFSFQMLLLFLPIIIISRGRR
jgi:hypothetical protein